MVFHNENKGASMKHFHKYADLFFWVEKFANQLNITAKWFMHTSILEHSHKHNMFINISGSYLPISESIADYSSLFISNLQIE